MTAQPCCTTILWWQKDELDQVTIEAPGVLFSSSMSDPHLKPAPIWWNGRKWPIQKMETVQNRRLRTILPVFNTTPLHALEVESGIPPLQILLNYMKQQAAARLAVRIDPTNSIYKRLPRQLWRGNRIRTAATPSLPMRLARRKPGMPNKFRESMVHEITKEIRGQDTTWTAAYETMRRGMERLGAIYSGFFQYGL